MGLNVTGGDSIDSTEIHPFDREGLGKLQNPGLGRVVLILTLACRARFISSEQNTYRRLSLRSIHEQRTDRDREDHVPKSLSPKNLGRSLRGVESSVDIDVHDFLEFRRTIFLACVLGANSSIGNDYIQLSEILRDLVNRR